MNVLAYAVAILLVLMFFFAALWGCLWLIKKLLQTLFPTGLHIRVPPTFRVGRR